MYSDFADVYDLLMGDADYTARAAYLLSLFERFDKKPSLILDLACGTGGFSNRFAAEGIQVIGVDVSPEMLMLAKEKSQKAGFDVLYLCQDAARLDLFGTVDGAVCCLDSLNHITDYGDFCRALQRTALFLEPDRLFIFDLNTPYKHEKILGNNTFVKESADVFCVWQNAYDPDDATVDITLDIFKGTNGLYHRTQEFLSERAYTKKQIEHALQSAGLSIEAVFDEMTENPAGENTQRAVYVTRKVKHNG